MADIRIAKRRRMNRKGSLEMLQTVFSDEDTNGSNGLEFSKLSTTEGKSDDDILFEKYSDKSINEHTVITEYAEWYMNTMNAYCNRWQDYSCEYDRKGNVVAIAYAYY